MLCAAYGGCPRQIQLLYSIPLLSSSTSGYFSGTFKIAHNSYQELSVLDGSTDTSPSVPGMFK